MIQNNELVRQYYFNLFTSSAEKITNGNNNHIFKWNIRDLQLSKNAEIGLVQVANNNLTITTERQYPPKAFNSFTEPISVSYLGQSVFKETITLTTADITYGSGTYEIFSSSLYAALSINKRLLFNHNLEDSAGAGWVTGAYNTSTGFYIGTDKYIINGYYGDWIIIKLPNPIVLSKFIFWARPNLINRSPGLWKCYGSNDGINYEEIPEASNNVISLTQSSYVNNIYEKQTNNITKSYLYIGFVIRKLSYVVDATTNMVNFNELRLYGREEILNYSPERQYPPKAWNSYTEPITSSGEILNINPTSYVKESIRLNITDIKYGIGDYIIYSSSTPSLGMRKNLFFNKDFNDDGAVWNYSTYTLSTGAYVGAAYIQSGYLGEWFIVKLISPIILSKFIFSIKSTFTHNAPSLWRCYGSNNGSTWEEIIEASNNGTALTSLNYNLNSYEHICNNNNKSYLYIGFTINKVIGISGSPGGSTLVITELQLFGKEILNNTIIIRALDTYQDGFDSQNRTAAIVYMGDDLRTIKNPTYHKLIARNLNSFSLNMTDTFDDSYNGIRNNIDLGLIFNIKDYGEQEETENTNNNLINIIE